jgi:hypothetical protein
MEVVLDMRWRETKPLSGFDFGIGIGISDEASRDNIREGDDRFAKSSRRPDVHAWKSAFAEENMSWDDRLNTSIATSVQDVSRTSVA